MSTLGAGREVAARAGDAVDDRPALHGVEGARLGHRAGDGPGLGPVSPPLVERDMNSNACLPACGSVPTPNTYAVPLAVRADRAAVERVALAVVGRRGDLVLRPGVAAVAGDRDDAAARARRCPSPGRGTTPSRRRRCRRTGCDDALSAQICSLSENVVDDCLLTTHRRASRRPCRWSPAAAARGSSVRDTAIASKPLKACSERAAPKLAVRFA